MDLARLYQDVRTFLLTQRAVSLTDVISRSCAYRGASGLKCAVGCLIPDEIYTPVIENVTVGCLLADDLPEDDDLLAESLSGQAGTTFRKQFLAHLQERYDPISNYEERRRLSQLLSRLQAVHDCADPDDWPRSLAAVAKEFGLDAVA